MHMYMLMHKYRTTDREFLDPVRAASWAGVDENANGAGASWFHPEIPRVRLAINIEVK